jgi:hypothetical protein
MRCVARAIVEGIGVGRLHDAGVTVAALRDSDFEPPDSIAAAMNTADRVAMATDLQACGIGRIVGSDVSLQFARQKNPDAGIDESDAACFARGFEGPAARRMIAGLMLNDVSIPDATRLARITVDCVGLAALVAQSAGVALSDAESQCVDRAGRSDNTFLRLLADEFRNIPSTATTAQARFGLKVFECLTPAHRRALAAS